jgi:hypothetical protein
MGPSVLYATQTCRIDTTGRCAFREATPTESHKPRLLDRVRTRLGLRHYSRRTEEAYVAWIRRYIVFHGKRHPADLGAPELTAFLRPSQPKATWRRPPKTRR